MCFSATASVASGGILLAVGFASISKVPKPSYLMLASAPIIFSIQQFFESAVWVCLKDSGNTSCNQIPIFGFVIIGQSLWPLWVPLSILLIERKSKRRKILGGLTFIGFIVSAYLLYFTISYGAEAKVIDHHISYYFKYPDSFISEMRWAYLIPAVLPNFVSSLKQVQFLGLLVFLALIITQIFFIEFTFSVWCFFTAIISIYVYYIMKVESDV